MSQNGQTREKSQGLSWSEYLDFFCFLGVSTQFATAGTWVVLVNNKTYVDGVEVDGIGIRDLVLDGHDSSKGKSQFLQLLTEDPSSVVNPNARYASDEALLTIDETALGADIFYAELELDNIDGAVGLSLLRFESVVDPCVATQTDRITLS